jgi:hypothetical protein
MRARAIVLRGLKVEFRALCEGRELPSPDGQFIATARSTYGPRWSDAPQSYYEFVVEDRAGTRLQYILIQVPREDLINWHREGSISWAEDSSSVTFEFKQTNLTLPIPADCSRLSCEGRLAPAMQVFSYPS